MIITRWCCTCPCATSPRKSSSPPRTSSTTFEHCLKASTSPHLAEQLTGSRDFLDGTLNDVMAGHVTVPADRTVIFSPFGLGVLDLAVGTYVYDQVARTGELHIIDEFFHELRRYGSVGQRRGNGE